jgi:hypothetical protein
MNSHRAHSCHLGLSCDRTLGSSRHWMFSVRICIAVPALDKDSLWLNGNDLVLCSLHFSWYTFASWSASHHLYSQSMSSKECLQWSSHCCRQSQWKHWTKSEATFSLFSCRGLTGSIGPCGRQHSWTCCMPPQELGPWMLYDWKHLGPSIREVGLAHSWLFLRQNHSGGIDTRSFE